MLKRKGNIDYTLFERRQISDYLDTLKGKKISINEFDDVIQDLLALGDQVISVCIGKIKHADEDLLNKLSYILEILADEDVISPLLQLVKDPELSDNHKTVILNVLCGLGVDPVDLPMEEIFEDFDRVAENAVQKILTDINKIENIPLFLNEFSTYPDDVKLMLIDEFVEEKSSSVVSVLGYLARSYDYKIIKPAIQGLSKIGTSETARVLKELTKVAEIKISSLAVKELQKLKMQGIEIGSSNDDLKAKQGELYKVFISSIDGRGSRAIWFVWKINNRKTLFQTVNFLINTNLGIKDCWGFTKIKENELKKMLKKLKEGVILLEGNYEYAVDLVRDALHINLEKGYPIPMEFGFWSTLFHAETIFPSPFKPDFSKLNIENIRANENLYEDSDLLHESAEFSDWFVAEPSVYDFAEKHQELEKKFKNKDIYKKQLEILKDRFIKQFLVPKKEIIKINLEHTIDFLLKLGETEKASIAMAALLNMDLKPYTKQPLIRRIYWESINIAINNMKNGFDMRVNPEAFE